MKRRHREFMNFNFTSLLHDDKKMIIIRWNGNTYGYPNKFFFYVNIAEALIKEIIIFLCKIVYQLFIRLQLFHCVVVKLCLWWVIYHVAGQGWNRATWHLNHWIRNLISMPRSFLAMAPVRHVLRTGFNS